MLRITQPCTTAQSVKRNAMHATTGRPVSAKSARSRLAAATLSLVTALLPVALPVPAMSMPDEGPAGDFANETLPDWVERSFDGNTHYELVEERGTRVLKGHTEGNASILYREETIDLIRTPIIEWSWKVDRTYTNIDEQTREGDDFPARLYVLVQTGFLPWQTLAINYVWASERPLGESWASPFTGKAHMVAIQSGDRHVGIWVRERRNVAEDFKTFFGEDITELSGYAVMVDGDNADVEAVAWFGRISFSAAE